MLLQQQSTGSSGSKSGRSFRKSGDEVVPPRSVEQEEVEPEAAQHSVRMKQTVVQAEPARYREPSGGPSREQDLDFLCCNQSCPGDYRKSTVEAQHYAQRKFIVQQAAAAAHAQQQTAGGKRATSSQQDRVHFDNGNDLSVTAGGGPTEQTSSTTSADHHFCGGAHDLASPEHHAPAPASTNQLREQDKKKAYRPGAPRAASRSDILPDARAALVAAATTSTPGLRGRDIANCSEGERTSFSTQTLQKRLDLFRCTSSNLPAEERWLQRRNLVSRKPHSVLGRFARSRGRKDAAGRFSEDVDSVENITRASQHQQATPSTPAAGDHDNPASEGRTVGVNDAVRRELQECSSLTAAERRRNYLALTGKLPSQKSQHLRKSRSQQLYEKQQQHIANEDELDTLLHDDGARLRMQWLALSSASRESVTSSQNLVNNRRLRSSISPSTVHNMIMSSSSRPGTNTLVNTGAMTNTASKLSTISNEHEEQTTAHFGLVLHPSSSGPSSERGNYLMDRMEVGHQGLHQQQIDFSPADQVEDNLSLVSPPPLPTGTDERTLQRALSNESAIEPRRDPHDSFLHSMSRPLAGRRAVQDLMFPADRAAAALPPEGTMNHTSNHPQQVHLSVPQNAAMAGLTTGSCADTNLAEQMRPGMMNHVHEPTTPVAPAPAGPAAELSKKNIQQHDRENAPRPIVPVVGGGLGQHHLVQPGFSGPHSPQQFLLPGGKNYIPTAPPHGAAAVPTTALAGPGGVKKGGEDLRYKSPFDETLERGATLDWDDLSFEVQGKKILRHCYGRLFPGEVACLIGPSGAGKSTLMNLLAARQRWRGPGLKLTENCIRFGGRVADYEGLKDSVALIMQAESFVETQTVEESLRFAAILRGCAAAGESTTEEDFFGPYLSDSSCEEEEDLDVDTAGRVDHPAAVVAEDFSPENEKFDLESQQPMLPNKDHRRRGGEKDKAQPSRSGRISNGNRNKTRTNQDKIRRKMKRKNKKETLSLIDQKINDVLGMLGLDTCRNVPVLRISGGQKKRLGVALELIADPKILFLDEPTSGLDSFSSLQLVQNLRTIAREKQAIICLTVHQPGSDLFALFDRVYCMRYGEILFHGLNKNLDNVLHMINPNAIREDAAAADRENRIKKRRIEGEAGSDDPIFGMGIGSKVAANYGSGSPSRRSRVRAGINKRNETTGAAVVPPAYPPGADFATSTSSNSLNNVLNSTNQHSSQNDLDFALAVQNASAFDVNFTTDNERTPSPTGARRKNINRKIPDNYDARISPEGQAARPLGDEVEAAAGTKSSGAAATPRPEILSSNRPVVPQLPDDEFIKRTTSTTTSSPGNISRAGQGNSPSHGAVLAGQLFVADHGGAPARTMNGASTSSATEFVFPQIAANYPVADSKQELPASIIVGTGPASSSSAGFVPQTSDDRQHQPQHHGCVELCRFMRSWTIPGFVAMCGHPIPLEFSTCDWLLNLAQSLEEAEIKSIIEKSRKIFDAGLVSVSDFEVIVEKAKQEALKNGSGSGKAGRGSTNSERIFANVVSTSTPKKAAEPQFSPSNYATDDPHQDEHEMDLFLQNRISALSPVGTSRDEMKGLDLIENDYDIRSLSQRSSTDVVLLPPISKEHYHDDRESGTSASAARPAVSEKHPEQVAFLDGSGQHHQQLPRSSGSTSIYHQPYSTQKLRPRARPSCMAQLYCLTKREVSHTFRSLFSLIFRTFTPVIQVVLYSIAFMNTGRNLATGVEIGPDGNLQPMTSRAQFSARIRDLFISIATVYFMSFTAGAQVVILNIPKERAVFLREYTSNLYSASIYLLSKMLVELPITLFQTLLIAAIMKGGYGYNSGFLEMWLLLFLSMSSGGAVGVAISTSTTMPEVSLVLLTVITNTIPACFAGVMRALSQIPAWIRWLKHVIQMSHISAAMAMIEFDSIGTVSENAEYQQYFEEERKSFFEGNDIRKELLAYYFSMALLLWFVFRGLGILFLKANAKSAID
ncbi:unnamed protein product [Amoebophrya sp. A120]|nr:unnamed protein product [Amoebophrya sp. A120]|eukprot:GSA120T00022075001.1